MNWKKWITDNIFLKDKIVNKRITEKWFNKHKPEEYKKLLKETSFLDEINPTLNQRLYHLYHRINSIMLCVVCKENTVNYKSFSKGYCTHCSQQCVSKTKRRKFQEKYGVKSPLDIKEFLKNAKRTNLRKHGDENYNNRKQAKQTKKERYGDENYNNIEKRSETNLKKYGHINPLSNNGVYKKALKTLKEKYNVKKNITNPFQIKEIKEKIKETNLKKHGIEFNSQRYIKNINDLNKDFIENNFINSNGSFNLFDFQEHFNISRSHSYVILNKYNIEYIKSVSNGERDIQNWIMQIEKNVIFNNRSIINPLELDIYLPEYDIAIEYNVVYWHNDIIRTDKNYHLNKTNLCEKQGIQLLHVFDYQWNDKFMRDIIKSMIMNRLGRSERIYARKCDIKNVSVEEKNMFLNENHIQGQCQSKINIGLYFNDRLVSLMTFGKTRFNKKYDWELLRFCNKKYNTVVGGASKLLKYFINNFKGSIITYADKLYSNGNLYEKLGFVKNKINPPSYFYFKNGVFLNRMKTQKKNLKKLLKNFDPNQTEYQNMINNGYNRIWDCGTIRYTIS